MICVALPHIAVLHNEKPKLSSFRVALQQEITHLDPLTAIDTASISILYLTQRGLTAWTSSGIKPDIAKTIELLPNGKTFRFTLNNLTWSDHSPLTADDFVLSWQRAFRHMPPSPNIPLFFLLGNGRAIFEGTTPLSSLKVSAPSPDILEVELEQPCPYFLELLTTVPFFPYKQDPVSGLPLSCGAFEIKKLDRTHSIKLHARDHSLTIDLQWIPDEQNALQLFLLGKLDFIGVPFSRLPADLPPSLHDHLSVQPLGATYALLVNPQKLNHRDVRRKIADTLRDIDWTALSDSGIHSNTKALIPLEDFPIPTTTSIIEPASLPQKLVLLAATSSLNRKVAQIIERNLHDLGIDVTIQILDNKAYHAAMNAGNFDLCLTWFTLQYPSPFSILGRFTRTSFQRPLFPLHLPEYDHLYRSSFDNEDALAQAQQLLIDDGICIPLFIPGSAYFISPSWQVGHSPTGFADFQQLTSRNGRLPCVMEN